MLKNLGSNQTELTIGNKVLFFSYNTCVCAEVDGKLFKTSKKWNNTTSKHINSWINGRIAESIQQNYFDELAK